MLFTVEIMIISAGEMKKAIGMLCEKLWSNHVIQYDSCAVRLSLMKTAMLLHGYHPEDFLVGTLISLPTNTHGDICDSENYHGIYLCSYITNIIEWIILLS